MSRVTETPINFPAVTICKLNAFYKQKFILELQLQNDMSIMNTE